jgi:hypothetical protein
MSSMARRRLRLPSRIALCVFLGIGAFFLWTEHRAHLLGVLPYALLLLCPLIHVLGHRGHGGHGAHPRDRERDGSLERSEPPHARDSDMPVGGGP